MVKPLVPPMVDILGPYITTPQHVVARPGRTGDAAGAGFSWWKDCTDDNAEDGTPITAEALNNFKAQLLTSIQNAGGVNVDDADEMLFRAIRYMGGVHCIAAGTANALELVPVSPFPSLGLAYGVLFRVFTGGSPNTGPVTIKLNALAPTPLLWSDGTQLAAGDLPAFTSFLTLYDGGNFRFLYSPSPSQMARRAAPARVLTFDASGTYTPTAGTVYITYEAQGAGASGTVGANSSSTDFGRGGGSGSYVEGLLLRSDFGANIALTVGAGGAGLPTGAAFRNGNAGGNTILAVTAGNIIAGGAPQSFWNAVNSGGTATVPGALVNKTATSPGFPNYGDTWIGGPSYMNYHGTGGNGSTNFSGPGGNGRIKIKEYGG